MIFFLFFYKLVWSDLLLNFNICLAHYTACILQCLMCVRCLDWLKYYPGVIGVNKQDGTFNLHTQDFLLCICTLIDVLKCLSVGELKWTQKHDLLYIYNTSVGTFFLDWLLERFSGYTSLGTVLFSQAKHILFLVFTCHNNWIERWTGNCF